MIRGENVNKLKEVMGRYFRVYDVRWEYDSAAFFVDLEPETLEKDFNSLRRDLIVRGYIPMILFEGGEHIVYVTERVPVKFKSVKFNIAMLIATICTTIFVGAINWWSYDSKALDPTDFMQVFTFRALGYGAVFFAFPLMSILGIHELGHYFMAKRHGVAASLPFFIPVPVPPLGTFGAFISMREPIPSKKALLDIGVAGPISGFCVAVPVILTGFWLTDLFAMPIPADAGGVVYMGSSVLYDLLASLFPTGDYLTHPTALAGWVGLLVTFLNLLPAGQLDGGHVARAMFGDKAKYFSYASIFLMLGLSFYYQYFGWILFIFIIVFIGVSHPPPLNDITKLDWKRWTAGAFGFILFFGCFTPVPLYPAEVIYDGVVEMSVDQVNLAPNETANLTAITKNIGNVEKTFTLKVNLERKAIDAGWNATLVLDQSVLKRSLKIKADGAKNSSVYVRAPANASVGDSVSVNVSVSWKDDAGKKYNRYARTLAIIGLLIIDVDEKEVQTAPGTSGHRNLTVEYLGLGNRTLRLDAVLPSGWAIDFGQDVFDLTPISGYKATAWYELTVPLTEPLGNRTTTIRVRTQWVEGEENGTAVIRNATAEVNVTVKVLQAFDIGLSFDRSVVAVAYGDKAVVNVTVQNYGNGKDQVKVEVWTVANLSVTPAAIDLFIDPRGEAWFDLTIEPLTNKTLDMNLLVVATSQGNMLVKDVDHIEVQVRD